MQARRGRTCKKSIVETKVCPVESSRDTAFMLGKPDTGRPMAPTSSGKTIKAMGGGKVIGAAQQQT